MKIHNSQKWDIYNMITDKLINRRMKLAEVEANLFRFSERRIALINQITILEEIIQEDKIKQKEKENAKTDTGGANSNS